MDIKVFQCDRGCRSIWPEKCHRCPRNICRFCYKNPYPKCGCRFGYISSMAEAGKHWVIYRHCSDCLADSEKIHFKCSLCRRCSTKCNPSTHAKGMLSDKSKFKEVKLGELNKYRSKPLKLHREQSAQLNQSLSAVFRISSVRGKILIGCIYNQLEN